MGPAIQSVEEIIKLIDLGTNLIRFNQSYGDVKSNSKLFKMYFEAKKLRPHKNCAIMLELAGREVRISNFKEPDGNKCNQIKVRAGRSIRIKGAYMPGESTQHILQCNFPDLQKVVKINDYIFFEDGELVGIVIDIEEENIIVEFRSTGTITGGTKIKLSNGK